MGGMDLHVILGPPGAGKAGRAVSVLRDAAATGVDAFLCVPGAVDRARFLRELAGTGSVLMGVEVGTFDQLVARVAGSPPVRRTDRAMERIVVRDALRDVPAFRAASRWSGFVDTAREHVDRLRRARVWGGPELTRVEQELPGESIEQWRALEARVGALLDERRLRDDAWFERRAAQAVRAGAPGVGAVVAYGFEHLPANRIELLEQLAHHVPVTVTLAWRPGRRVHERAAELRDRWRAKGAFVEELDAVAGDHPVLDWLGSELFEDAPSAAPSAAHEPDAPAPVAFVDCCGALQEAEEVVRELALLRRKGLAWDDMAVASANAAHDDDLLLAACRRAGIPARLQTRRRAIDVPAGRAVHAVLDAIVTDDALRLVAALRSPIFGLDPSVIDQCELQLRADRLRDGDPLLSATLQRVLPHGVAPLVRLRRSDDGVVAAMRGMLATLLPSDVGELDLLRGLAALLEGLVIAAGSDARIALVDVRDAVAAFPLTVPDRSDSGTVVIASLDDLRSVAFDAVVLRGMHLAGFRAAVDEEADAPRAGRDLLHLAVTRARRTVRVVRQAAGADGGQLAASPAWLELRRLQPDAPLRTRRLGDVVVAPDDVRLTSEMAPSVAVALGRGLTIDGAPPALLAMLDTMRRRARATTVTGAIAAELAGLRQISVTAIERYAVCSAKWFVERRLRIDDADEDRSRIIEGNLAHALLQRVVPDARLQQWDGERIQTRLEQLAPELAAQVDRRAVLGTARIARIVAHVHALIDQERTWQTPIAIEVERSFGSDAEDAIAPGYRVDDVEVVGRIDRIDRYGGRAVLHDYKYSSTDRHHAHLLQDRQLQLLVYWLAMQQPGSLIEPMGAIYRAITRAGKPSGVFSPELRELGIIGPKHRVGVLDDDARDELLHGAAQVVDSAVAGIRAGHVSPLEDPAACPSHCRLQAICRVGEGAA